MPRTRCALFVVLLLSCSWPGAVPVQTPTVEELIAWLDVPEKQWIATVRLQESPDAATRALLQPGRIASTGPHGRWTGHMLALAKLGSPAIPAIRARALELLTTGNPRAHVTVAPLINVLGAMGPAAVPALVDIADVSVTPSVTMSALEEIVRLEPRREVFGQQISPWALWRPADDWPIELERTILPLLPRLRQVMESAAAGWHARQSPQPQRPAAYLLARWGSGDARTRGLAALHDLASAKNPFHDSLEAIRLLHALKAPGTAALIRATSARVPDYGNLKGTYLLTLAIALHQLGDRDYSPLLTAALQDHRPDVRMDVADFVARSGEIAHGALLLPLLNDRVEWNQRTVAGVAHESLGRLTLAQVPPDADVWRRWLARHNGVTRQTLLANWIEGRGSIARVPITEADGWINRLDVTDGARAFALVDAYLLRTDSGRSGGGGGPAGMHGPGVISLLLGMVQRGVPGARERLERALSSPSTTVRIYAALALSAYDRRRAIDRLAIEANRPEGEFSDAGEFLLQLGDARGFPTRLARLGSNHGVVRQFACGNLRLYAQQTLPCDVGDAAPDRVANVVAWRAWWERNAPTVRVNVREAEIDRLAYPGFAEFAIAGMSAK